jgi:outer membrane protein TolC
VELVDLQRPVDEMIPIALTHRPELASKQAQVQATLTMLKQEKLRPLIPSVLLRGYSTPVTGTLGFGYVSGGSNGGGNLRDDFDLQLLWQLDNLGFGNHARIRQRNSDNAVALLELFRLQDRVAAEVAQAYAQAQLAAERVVVTESGVKSAVISADKNLLALGETKGMGAMIVLLVRPQEVVAAIQALSRAYFDYYAAVADANRAQFRLYRGLGRPSDVLAQGQALTTSLPDVAAPDASAAASEETALPQPAPVQSDEE